MKAERIHKVLARIGLGSRREIEAWIRAREIRVNGDICKLGQTITPADKVMLRGRQVKLPRELPATRILAYYKPEGEICSRRDEAGGGTVFDHLPRLRQGRWISMGRLDVNTSGLLLFTNNGELGHQLIHPSREVEREYLVRVLGDLPQGKITHFLTGVLLADGMAKFTDVVCLDPDSSSANHNYCVVVTEGRHRLVRRMFAQQGTTVSRLKRVRFGSYILPPGKRRGQYWDLDATEIQSLQAACAAPFT